VDLQPRAGIDRHEAIRWTAMELQLARSHRDPAYFHGYLMVPLLREGDEVSVEPISWERVRVGDIVTYRDADKFPTRRVMKIKADERLFVIMADNVRPRRSWLVSFDHVIGRVQGRRRDNSWTTARDWQWRLQRARVLARYRIAASWLGGIVRGVRRLVRHLDRASA
jgi:hypothetical protein